MIAHTNEKGRQTKLLVAIAAFIMVACAAIVVLPAAEAAEYHEVPAEVTATDVNSAESFATAIESGETVNIKLTGNFEITSYLNIPANKTVTIYGYGYTIKATGDAKWEGNPTKSIINVEGNATIYDVVFDSNNVAYGVNFYKSTSTMDNVTSNNSYGAAFTVGDSSNVTATNLYATGYSWGGVNADKGATLTIDTVDGVGYIYSENSNGTTENNTTMTVEDSPLELNTTITQKPFEAYFASFEVMDKYYSGISTDAGEETVTVDVLKDIALKADMKLSENTVLNVNNGATLTLADNVTLTNPGSTSVAGAVTGGTIVGDVTVDADTGKVTSKVDGTASIASYNALDGYTEGTVTGTGTSGSWTFDGTTLTLKGYEGSKYFYNDSIQKVVVEGASTISVGYNAISIDVDNPCFGAIRNGGSNALEISGDALTIKVAMNDDKGNKVALTETVNESKVTAVYAAGALTVNSDIIILITGTVDAGETAYSEAVYGLYAGGDITVGTTETPVAVDITVAETDGLAFAVCGNGDKTFTNVTGQITGGNRGIQVGGHALSFTDSDLVITGGEKAIQANNAGGNVTISTSSIVLELMAVEHHNVGQNDRFGIKVNSLTVEADSTLVSDGIRLYKADTTDPTFDNQGAIIVNGGYTQTSGYVAGFVSDVTGKATNVFKGIPAELGNQYIYLSDDAKTTNVTIAGTTTDAITGDYAVSVEQANKMIETGAKNVAIITTGGSVDITNLVGGKDVTVTVNAITGTVNAEFLGTIVTDSIDATVNEVEVAIKGTDLSVKADGTIVGTNISGTLTGKETEINLTDVSTTGLKVSAGSVIISGDLVLNGEKSDIVVINDTSTGVGKLELSDISITGTGTIVADEIVVMGTVTIGSGVTIQVASGSTLTISDKAVLTGTGTVDVLKEGENNGKINLEGTGTISDTVNVKTPAGGVTVSGESEFVAALPYYEEITVDGNLNFGEEWKGKTITVDDEKKITVNGTITVGEGVTIEFKGLAVIDFNTTEAHGMTIAKGGALVIDNADVYTSVILEEGSTYTPGVVTTTIDGSTNDPAKIGFGKTVTFSDGYTIGSEIIVYGTIDVPADRTLNISRNANLDIKDSGAITVEGTLNMNGAVTVAGDITVSGTMNMASTLTVGADGKVDVTGTMNITGTLNGAVDDRGTVVFAGTAGTDAKVNMHNGAVLDVTSLAGSNNLTVTGAADYVAAAKDDKFTVENNEIVLNGVAGLKVTSTETVTKAYVAGTTGDKDVAAQPAVVTIGMDLSGTVTAGSITVEAAGDAAGDVTVKNTLDLESESSLTLKSGDYTIEGTINAAAGAEIANNATLTVTGEINVTAETGATITGNGKINAVYYDVTSEASVTRTYTTLAQAVIVTNADDNTLTVLGTSTVAVGETVTVPADIVIVNEKNSGSEIVVNGTLVFNDYAASYDETTNNKINADVKFEDLPKVTFTSLANAIAMGETDIILNDNVTVSTDLAIDEGVRVSSDEYNVTVTDGAKLTVGGALELTDKSTGVDLKESEKGTGKLVLDGTGYVYTDADNSEALEASVDGAYYQKLPSEEATEPVYVIATIDRAAADSKNVYVVGDTAAITVIGDVSTENSLTLTAPKDAKLTVTVESDSTDKDKIRASSLTAPGVTLDGNVTVATADANTTGNASVVDTTVAFGANSVVLDNVEGVLTVSTVATAETEATSLDVVAGTETLHVKKGTVTVESGAASVSGNIDSALAVKGTADIGNLTMGEDSKLTVSGTADITGTVETEGAVSVPGTVTVSKELTSEGSMSVSGTVTVTGTMTSEGDLTIVDGAVSTATAKDAKEPGTITLSGETTVGERPTAFGQTSAGSLVGATIETGCFVKAYNGATVTIEDAASTVLNIQAVNSSEYYQYMTVYANEKEVDLFAGVIYNETFCLQDYDTGLFYGNTENDIKKNTGLYAYGTWYTQADRVSNTALTGDVDVGEHAQLYAQVKLASVEITISEGTGLNLYIDGIAVESGSYTLTIGAHTVSFDVSAGYDGSEATISFGGQAVTDGTISIDSGSAGKLLSVTGAVPSSGGTEIIVPTPEPTPSSGGDDGLSLTDILLIILVVLIVVMAIIVALRLMRS